MADRESGPARYPVRHVINRTGLTADVLRAWERRYGAVRPHRSPAGQRLYSERDVARLLLLRRATLDGHSIGAIAALDDRELEKLLETSPVVSVAPVDDASPLVRDALAATAQLDATALDATLRRAAMTLGATAFVDDFAPRLLVEIGDRWHAGMLTPAHEHLATRLVRRALDAVAEAFTVAPRAPRLVVATPAGEHHELGALLVSAAAAQEGWRTVYLGANLPAADIVQAARQVRARIVAMSVIAVAGKEATAELRALARALPDGVTLLIGGRSADHVGSSIRKARVLGDIGALRRALRAIGSVSADAGSEDARSSLAIHS